MDEIAGRRRVLLISPDFGFGGAEKSIANLSALLEPYTELHFAVFNRIASQAYDFKGQLHSLDVPGGKNHLQKLLAFVKRVSRLKRLKHQLKIETCISFLEGSDYINVLSRGTEKVILSVRGSKKFDPNIVGVVGFVRHKWLIPWVYSQADQLVVVAQGIGNELRNEYGLKKEVPIEVIPNYYKIDTLQDQAADPLPQEWEMFFKSNTVLVAVGRLSREKGFDKLVDVFAEVKKEQPGIKLLLIGSGKHEKEILFRIQLHGLKESRNMVSPDFSTDIILAGFQANPLKYIARSTLFILSSLTEGFPNALIEAMAVGVPVLAGDCPYGVREILIEEHGRHEEFGILLPVLSDLPDTVISWKDAIVRLVQDERLRMDYRKRGKARAGSFGPEGALAQWRKIIQ